MVASTTGTTSPTAARLVVVTLLLAVSASVTPLAAAIVPPGVVVASAIATAIVVVTIATTVSLAIAATITLAIAAAAIAATSIASLVAPALVLVASTPSTAASASASTTSTSAGTEAAAATPSTTHASGIGLGCRFLDVALFVANLLLWLPADQLHGVFSLKGHKSKLAPLVLCLVKRKLHIFHGSELLEVGLDVSLWHVGLQSANKNLFDPGARLRRLRVNLFALDSVWGRLEHSLDRVLCIECDKTEASGLSCRGICLDVDINDNAELREVFPKILVIGVPAYATNKEFSLVLVSLRVGAILGGFVCLRIRFALLLVLTVCELAVIILAVLSISRKISLTVVSLLISDRKSVV